MTTDDFLFLAHAGTHIDLSGKVVRGRPSSVVSAEATNRVSTDEAVNY